MNFAEWVNQRYYHGSYTKLKPGTILRPNPEYEKDWNHTDFYSILEFYRPKNKLSHKNAVFMCDNLDDIDNAGGATQFIYEIEPLGPVEKHDLNWSSEISMLAEEPEKNARKIKTAAMHYWMGEPHPNEQVWEYLTTYARVVALVAEE